MENKVIASESFILTLEHGEQVIMRLDLVPYAGFQYGNKTAMLMFENGKFVNQYDTRYVPDCEDPKRFHDWSLDFMKGYVRPTVKVDRADAETTVKDVPEILIGQEAEGK